MSEWIELQGDGGDAERLDRSRPVVPFFPVRCPQCGSTKPRTYGQRASVRYHKCYECRAAFTSYEIGSLEELRVWLEGQKMPPGPV